MWVLYAKKSNKNIFVIFLEFYAGFHFEWLAESFYSIFLYEKSATPPELAPQSIDDPKSDEECRKQNSHNCQN